MEELVHYLGAVAKAGCDVVVVDGSGLEIFARHRSLLAGVGRQIPVERRFGYLNDKVNAIHTGIAHSLREKIILADDDIRYTDEQLARIAHELDQVDVVRPQNYLDPLPWWAKMEAARMLINRALLPTGDYPGSCAFRRAIFGPYDGDVLFDNEEIIRHFARAGARVRYALDFFVRKRPPRFRKWLEQRPRQAYEDFPLRAKSALFFALAPIAWLLLLIAARKTLLALLISLGLVSIGLALRGRARGRAAAVVPLSVCFLAPFWVLERSLSTWWAFCWFVRYGGYPFGDRILSKGVGRDWFAGGRVAAQQFRA